MKVCIVGASGKLGRYMVQHCLDRDYEVVGVCREQSVEKLAEYADRILIVPGATNDRGVIELAVADCDGVLTVLVPWGVHHYFSGTAQAVLDYARPGTRLIFSCGWHITRDGYDVYSCRFLWTVRIFGRFAKLVRFADLDDQVEACRRIFASDTRWTVVRGSDLEEGPSEGSPRGVATLAIRCSRATAPGELTSPYLWSTRWSATNWCRKPLRSSVAAASQPWRMRNQRKRVEHPTGSHDNGPTTSQQFNRKMEVPRWPKMLRQCGSLPFV